MNKSSLIVPVGVGRNTNRCGPDHHLGEDRDEERGTYARDHFVRQPHMPVFAVPTTRFLK